MGRVGRVGILASALFAVAGPLAGQATFEVASVKPNRSGFPGGDTEFRPGQFIARNQTLRILIVAAYALEDFRVVGGPDWVASERFDVQARATSPVTRTDAMPMLQALLADRFGLRVHMEPRERPVYAMVPGRPGTLGPRIRAADPAACVDRGPQPPRLPPGELPSCGMLPMTTGRLSGRSVRLDLLAAQIAPLLRRVVQNQTGMRPLRRGSRLGDRRRAARRVGEAAAGSAAATARPRQAGAHWRVQEQLGLKLDPRTAAVPVLVIDAAERPSEN